MNIHFVAKSSNRKTGAIPVTYSERETCPPSCPHYRSDCYAEDYYTRLAWDKVAARGSDIWALADNIAALPDGQLWRFNVAGDLPGCGEAVDAATLGEIVRANIGRRGFTYTHKKSADAIMWARHATQWGFTVNLSADDAGEADALAAHGLPLVCIVPMDTPERTTTPAGRPIVVCPAQTHEDKTCANCGLCQQSKRAVIVGFRAHGSRAKSADQTARRVIPINKAT
jgi:hypothetical protein